MVCSSLYTGMMTDKRMRSASLYVRRMSRYAARPPRVRQPSSVAQWRARVVACGSTTGGFTLRAGVCACRATRPLRPFVLALAAGRCHASAAVSCGGLACARGLARRRSSMFAAPNRCRVHRRRHGLGHARRRRIGLVVLHRSRRKVRGGATGDDGAARPTASWVTPTAVSLRPDSYRSPSGGRRSADVCAGAVARDGAGVIVAGPRRVHVVYLVLGALAVWLVYVLALAARRRLAGACAALLLAVSPIFLYQIVQPMSDVPAATFWLAAVVLVARGSPARCSADSLVGCALTRPNLPRDAP